MLRNDWLKTIKRKSICNAMKRKELKVIVLFIILMTASCGEPETVVTDIVHTDGSVTRKIEMKNSEKNFKISNVQVPYDSTWAITDSLEISQKGDTTYIRCAEKLFTSVDEINKEYLSDSTRNKNISRRAEFRKRFKWFNNEYRFAEVIEKTMSYGYPASDFLNERDITWFYSPDNVQSEKINGPDSLKYKAFKDSVDQKIENWTLKSMISEWIGEFSRLAKGKTEGDMTEASLRSREDEFLEIVKKSGNNLDSLWTHGIILREFIGEANALKYQTEADSAVNMVSKRIWVDFTQYTQRIAVPGEIIGTNGFIDSAKNLLWPVHSDFFLTEPYTMYAESRTPNKWAWIVSGIFLLFVLAGIIFKIIKK
jgi:hypothetical protein